MSTQSTIKVRVTLTVTVNPEDWARAYGGEALAEIREDVKTYVLTAIQDSAAADEGGIVSAVLR